MNSDYLLVLTNLPDTAIASKLAQQLVTLRLAACVNQLPPCTATYFWENQLETTTEIPLLIKTTRATYPQLEAYMLAAHPYQLPEIIAIPLAVGLPAYLDWVAQQVQGSPAIDKE